MKRLLKQVRVVCRLAKCWIPYKYYFSSRGGFGTALLISTALEGTIAFHVRACPLTVWSGSRRCPRLFYVSIQEAMKRKLQNRSAFHRISHISGCPLFSDAAGSSPRRTAPSLTTAILNPQFTWPHRANRQRCHLRHLWGWYRFWIQATSQRQNWWIALIQGKLILLKSIWISALIAAISSRSNQDGSPQLFLHEQALQFWRKPFNRQVSHIVFSRGGCIWCRKSSLVPINN